MKILDLCEFYSERGGGVASYLNRLVTSGNDLGHEVVIVAPGPRSETEERGRARIIRYAAPPMPYDGSYHWPWRVDLMRAIVKAERPDVLQLSSPFIPAAVAATLRAKVRSYVYHSDPIGCYAEYELPRRLAQPFAGWALSAAWAWMRAVCNWGDVTVVSGEWLKAKLEARGCTKVAVVPFGIDHQHFGPERRREATRRELMGSLADDPRATLVLITGRLAVDKRQALLVQALQRVARVTPLALLVVGTGPERERLEALASSLPVARFIPFTKDRAEYARLLASADVLLHGSRCETYGFVIVEALASGTPVLVPGAGAAESLVTPECAGIYPPTADAEGVANALRALLARPRRELSLAACRVSRSQPTMDSHFERLFLLYESLVAGSPLPIADSRALLDPSEGARSQGR